VRTPPNKRLLLLLLLFIIVREVNKALRFPFLLRQHKLKQVLLKLAVEKDCLHNLGEDQRKIDDFTSENKMLAAVDLPLPVH